MYNLREKWCLILSKVYFSGGVLSLQKSETTNRFLKTKLHATAYLCNSDNIFCGVVSKWRSKENDEDHRCSKDNTRMTFPSINILEHALSMCTIETFLMFEKEFIDSVEYNYEEVQSSTCDRLFEV